MANVSKLLIFVLLVTILSIACSAREMGIINTGGGIQLSQADISGHLACSASGNPTSDGKSPPLAGVNTSLSCDGGKTTLAVAQTDNNGHFKLRLNSLAPLLDPLKCGVNVKLPVSDCSVLPTTGILHATIGSVNMLESLMNRVHRFGVGMFKRAVPTI